MELELLTKEEAKKLKNLKGVFYSCYEPTQALAELQARNIEVYYLLYFRNSNLKTGIINDPEKGFKAFAYP
jgi:hypothetical protein